MSRTVRIRAFAVLAVALAGFLLLAFHGLPAFGHYQGRYGHLLNQVGVAQRHATNVVTSVVFDYRGLDTLGEEFILFSSVVGVVFILRGGLTLSDRETLGPVGLDAQRVIGSIMVPAAFVVGLWLVAYGYVTPGGGFQGGVATAASIVLIWVATSYRDYRRLATQEAFDAIEGVGAAGFVGLGLVGLGLSTAFLANFLPLGSPGTLASAGSIGLLNLTTAVEVTAANVLIFNEFLQEYGLTFPGVKPEDEQNS